MFLLKYVYPFHSRRKQPVIFHIHKSLEDLPELTCEIRHVIETTWTPCRLICVPFAWFVISQMSCESGRHSPLGDFYKRGQKHSWSFTMMHFKAIWSVFVYVFLKPGIKTSLEKFREDIGRGKSFTFNWSTTTAKASPFTLIKEMESVSQTAERECIRSLVLPKPWTRRPPLCSSKHRGTWNLLCVLDDLLWHEGCPYQYWLASPPSLETLTQLFDI